MTLDDASTQAPSPPSRLQRILIQSRFDTRLTMANGEQILLTIIIPIGVLLGLWWFPGIDLLPEGVDPDIDRVNLALPGAICVAIVSSAFASLAIGTGFDRRSGSLLLLATTPLSRVELVWARAIATLLIVFGQIALLLAVAGLLGWRPSARSLLAPVVVIVGSASLAACAIALAGLLRAEATLAVANGVLLVLLVLGGTAIPVSSLPPVIATIAFCVPSGALGQALRWSLLDLPGTVLPALAVLVIWALLASVLARRTFRWD